jgi:hypothetical protein
LSWTHNRKTTTLHPGMHESTLQISSLFPSLPHYWPTWLLFFLIWLTGRVQLIVIVLICTISSLCCVLFFLASDFFKKRTSLFLLWSLKVLKIHSTRST